MSNCTILVQVLCNIYQIPLETVVQGLAKASGSEVSPLGGIAVDRCLKMIFCLGQKSK